MFTISTEDSACPTPTVTAIKPKAKENYPMATTFLFYIL
jgi:hypothetical protein